MAQRQAEQEDRDAGGPRVPFEKIAPYVLQKKQKKLEEKKMKEALLKAQESHMKNEGKGTPRPHPITGVVEGPGSFPKPFPPRPQLYIPTLLVAASPLPPPPPAVYPDLTFYSIEQLMESVYTESTDAFVYNVLNSLRLPQGFVLDMNSRGNNIKLFKTFFERAIEEARRTVVPPPQPLGVLPSAGHSSGQGQYHAPPQWQSQPPSAKRPAPSSSSLDELAAKRARRPSGETNILHFENLSPNLHLSSILELLAVEKSTRGVEELMKQNFWISSSMTECFTTVSFVFFNI
jgi:hypothetical protein